MSGKKCYCTCTWVFFGMLAEFTFVILAQDIVPIQVPIKCKKSERGYKIVTLEMIEPHSLVAFLFNGVGIQIGDDKVQAFWQHHRSVNSSFLESYQGSDHHIPLGLYGDGARARQIAYMPVEKVVGVWLNLPLWRPKSARHSRFLLFAIDEEDCYGRKTMNAVYKRIVWSLNHMFHGRWPTHDPDGNLLGNPNAGTMLTPDNKAFALVEHRGDWVYFKWLLGFRSSWKAGASAPVCYRCAAYGTGDPRSQYYHVGENSPCWETEYDKCTFLAEEMPRTDPCCLLAFPLQGGPFSTSMILLET